MPDIDVDFDTRRRDEVIEYIYDKYGAERVAAVCTVNTFRARSAIRDVGKALGVRRGGAGQARDALPAHPRLGDQRGGGALPGAARLQAGPVATSGC